MPWGGLWLLVPVAVAVSLLLAWRWGAWGVASPVAMFVAGMVLEGPFSLWVWWIPVAALTGAWMGLREEGGELSSGERGWMLLPVLLLAALMPWMANYPDLVASFERWMRSNDQQLIALYRQLGYQGERLQAMERILAESAALRTRALPSALPSVLFIWMVVLVAAGRGLAGPAVGHGTWGGGLACVCVPGCPVGTAPAAVAAGPPAPSGAGPSGHERCTTDGGPPARVRPAPSGRGSSHR